MIYFDNSATTKVLPEAAERAVQYMIQDFYNPSAAYSKAYSVEKDLKSVEEKVKELKTNVEVNTDTLNKLNILFQELSGSVNQLKLIIDEFKEYHKEEKANKYNVLFQLIIPIILAVIFFFSGLFFKSCSSIHQQNVQKPSSNNQNWEYRNFESSKNK